MLKGGLVLIDPATAAVLRIVVLQYNPDSLSRTLQLQATGAGSDRLGGVAAQGAAGGGGEVRVRLHVERLVLEGIEVTLAERAALQLSLEVELGQLLAGGGVSPDLRRGVAVPAVRAKGFEMRAEGGGADLGGQIARSVYGGIGK